MNRSGGYHEYIEKIPRVHRGNTMSTLGGVQYIGGNFMSTLGDVQYIGGYHEYIGGIP